MTARARTRVSFEDSDDYVAVTVVSAEEFVSIHLTDSVDLFFYGEDVERQVELLLNRLRIDLNAQVAERGR